ncbi:hypothetical protein SS50377_28227 [Spironucleus salmonicida]|uniref:Uncharacterized protein n=1 Tax=Spironucleus salmonicida TaxID=348837 RepID=V6M4X4_9EUKA|nr:hypothetical protein SS50377_28227 [Spironucleus salmonicida]|eukprot:EST48409.1 Hypothetical protein SS50377_11357 [Spironucleus salmonicida]
MRSALIPLSSLEYSQSAVQEIFDRVDTSLMSPIRSQPIRPQVFSNPVLHKEKIYANFLNKQRIEAHQILQRTLTDEIDRLRKERQIPKRIQLKSSNNTQLFENSFIQQQQAYLGANQFKQKIIKPIEKKNTWQSFYKAVEVNSSKQRAADMTLRQKNFLEFDVKK